MRLRDPERAIVAAGETVPDWSGGTRLGETLRIFLDRWGQRGLARGAVVVVFSDGWERGDPALLAEQMARLHRIAHRVVWVNPHRGKAGYEPVQQGVVAALPYVRRLRGRSLAGDVRRAGGGGRACVRCCPSCWRGGEAGETVGVGTVVATFQSAPRPPGASMLVGPDGTAVGSVSGGCVEGAVYELAQRSSSRARRCCSATASPTTTPSRSASPAAGSSTCTSRRSSRETFPELGEIADDVEAGRPVAVATVVEHPDPAVARPAARRAPRRDSPDESVPAPSSSVRDYRSVAAADDAVRDDALGLLACGHNATLTYGPDGERRGEGMRVFVWAFAPKPRMLVFGAIDFAAAVARVGASSATT